MTKLTVSKASRKDAGTSRTRFIWKEGCSVTSPHKLICCPTWSQVFLVLKSVHNPPTSSLIGICGKLL